MNDDVLHSTQCNIDFFKTTQRHLAWFLADSKLFEVARAYSYHSNLALASKAVHLLTLLAKCQSKLPFNTAVSKKCLSNRLVIPTVSRNDKLSIFVTSRHLSDLNSSA